MARHRKLTQKFAGFPIFKVGTSGDTFPVTSPFTTGFTGYTDGLSLDLQFAADKTLTARKGPTPVFTRGSGDNGGTTYFGPSGINVAFSFDGNDYDEAVFQNTVFNGRFRWTGGDISLSYTGTAWSLSFDGNNVATSAPTTAYRPDLANWSGTGVTVAATSTFGIVKAANNEPRFDHDPVTLACKGLLIEESRTNSITGSNAFNTWTLSNCTVAASSVVTPEGTADAWKLVEDSLTATHSATRPFSPVSGTTYTASAWIKSAENGFAFFGLTGGGFAATFISVNLSTGAVSTAVGTPVGAASASYSNGWWRVSFSLAATASLSSVIDIRLSRDGNWANRSYLGNGVNGMYCYGGQVEAGAFPTSYIPTVASSVVRSADTCTITGAGFTTVYNESEHTLFAEASGMSHASFPSYLSFDNTTSGEQSTLAGFPTTNRAVCSVSDGGVTSASVQIAVTLNQNNKMAAAMKLNSFQLAVNNVLGTEDTSGTMPTATSLKIGRNWSSAVLNGTFKQVKVFRKRLPNAKLQTLTT